VNPFDWWRAGALEELPELLHLPSNEHYQLRGIVLREYDLEPCALYRGAGMKPGPAWARPLRDVLEGDNWEWHPRYNDAMSELATLLEAHDRRREA
jgi:hypothetical protein